MLRIILTIAFSIFALVANAEIYKWTDGEGKVHFSDRKPAEAKAEKVKVQINSYTHVTYDLPPLPSETTPKATKNVVMYSTTWCGYCKKARAYFASHNIPYTDYDVENSEEGKAKYDAIGGRGVPVIFVGQSRMNGFSPESFEHLYSK